MLKVSEDFAKYLTTRFLKEHFLTTASELLHADFNLLDGNEKNIF